MAENDKIYWQNMKGRFIMAYKKTEKLIQYNNEYNRNNYDRVSLMLPTGKKEIIKSALHDGESVNGFINALIDKELAARGFGISDSARE